MKNKSSEKELARTDAYSKATVTGVLFSSRLFRLESYTRLRNNMRETVTEHQLSLHNVVHHVLIRNTAEHQSVNHRVREDNAERILKI